MKAPTSLLLAALLVTPAAFASSRKAGGKKPSYPGIIQMNPPGAPTSPAADGKLISTEVSGLDLRFLRSASEAGLLLAYLSELAKTKGFTESVKKLSSAIEATQTEENEKLGQLAARKGVSVATDTAALRSQLVADLEALDGLKFDKVVLDQFLAVNRQSVSAYEAGVGSDDADIKAFVTQMLPVAKARLHLTSKMAGAPSATLGPQFRTSAPAMVR